MPLNLKKNKIMDKDKPKEDVEIQLDGKEIKRVNSFECLGARIEANGKSNPEIRRLAVTVVRLV